MQRLILLSLIVTLSTQLVGKISSKFGDFRLNPVGPITYELEREEIDGFYAQTVAFKANDIAIQGPYGRPWVSRLAQGQRAAEFTIPAISELKLHLYCLEKSEGFESFVVRVINDLRDRNNAYLLQGPVDDNEALVAAIKLKQTEAEEGEETVIGKGSLEQNAVRVFKRGGYRFTYALVPEDGGALSQNSISIFDFGDYYGVLLFTAPTDRYKVLESSALSYLRTFYVADTEEAPKRATREEIQEFLKTAPAAGDR